jgi:toxin ParE1/3/4
VTKPVVISDEAIADLANIFEWIADAAGAAIAQTYLDRLRDYCQSFALFPERGTSRSDLEWTAHDWLSSPGNNCLRCA